MQRVNIPHEEQVHFLRKIPKVNSFNQKQYYQNINPMINHSSGLFIISNIVEKLIKNNII